jgi:hypothetical protein
MSFPDYEALRCESQPAIPGAATRLMLLRRGAGVERERILEFVTNWTVTGTGDYPKGYRDALKSVAKHIKEDFGGN